MLKCFLNVLFKNIFVLFVFYILFRDIKSLFICHKVLGVSIIIQSFWGYKNSYINYYQAAYTCYYFFFTKAQEQTNF